MDLSEFLLARIAEDEKLAREAALIVGWDGFGEQRIRSGQHWNPSYHVVKRVRDEGPTDRREVAECAPLFGMSTAAHIARHDPARVLAECDAKRRIVEQYADYLSTVRAYRSPRWFDAMNEQDKENARQAEARHRVAEDVARLLALPYADHTDYREEWKP